MSGKADEAEAQRNESRPQRLDRNTVELLNEPLTPFGKNAGDVLNVQALGYEYAASAAAIPVAG